MTLNLLIAGAYDKMICCFFALRNDLYIRIYNEYERMRPSFSFSTNQESSPRSAVLCLDAFLCLPYICQPVCDGDLYNFSVAMIMMISLCFAYFAFCCYSGLRLDPHR